MRLSRIENGVLMAMLVLGIAGCSRQAQTYDECVALTVSAGMDSAAVAAAYAACRAGFPDTAPADRPLTLDEIVNLTGEAGLSYGNWPSRDGAASYYSGTLHNGNPHIRVTELEVTLTTAMGQDSVVRAYRDTVVIEPGETAPFGFNVRETGDAYRWHISAAKGIPTR